MKDTKIEWADSTWNPVTGCLHGCPYCYARSIARRFGYIKRPDYDETEIHDLRESLFNHREGKGIVAYPFNFAPTFHRYRLDQVFRWKEPRNIFVCSMADLFGAWVPDSWIEMIFSFCEKAAQHKYMFLTKNPARYLKLSDAGKLPKGMWYGSTVTKPDEAYMYCSKDWHSFISIEPIMEDFGEMKGIRTEWVIVGAETGNRKDKVVPKKSWIENIAHECEKNGIPLFMKDSLIPIVGEENMKREFPAGLAKEEQL